MNLIGIVYALIACACWATSFIVPLFIPDFNPIEVAVGRYFAYGLFSLPFFLTFLFRREVPKAPRVWGYALLFALTGNFLYYLLVVLGIRSMGASLVTILYAANPLILSLWGNVKEKTYPVRLLLLPGLMVVAGVMVLHLQDFQVDATLSLQSKLIGLVATSSAILMWSFYSVFSARFVKSENLPVPMFNALVGVVCLLVSVVFGAFCHLSGAAELSFLTGELPREVLGAFVAGISILGLVTAMVGTFFWQSALKIVPTSIIGQIIVFEPLFGLSFSYFVIGRWPTTIEVLGASIVTFSVLYFIRRVRAYQQAALA